LIVKSEDGNMSEDVVVGLVSFGTGCANPDYPGVYTRVAGFAEFIVVDGLCEMSQYAPLDESICAKYRDDPEISNGAADGNDFYTGGFTPVDVGVDYGDVAASDALQDPPPPPPPFRADDEDTPSPPPPPPPPSLNDEDDSDKQPRPQGDGPNRDDRSQTDGKDKEKDDKDDKDKDDKDDKDKKDDKNDSSSRNGKNNKNNNGSMGNNRNNNNNMGMGRNNNNMGGNNMGMHRTQRRLRPGSTAARIGMPPRLRG
jgi:hypothetical protein